jgi:serine/threonine protein kinase
MVQCMSSDPLSSATTASERAVVNNRYELQRLLGTGTTGMVYLAEDLHLQRKVAVKILDAKMADRSDVCLRFDQEIRITARLDHPGVVAVFESARTH